ncbi:MAG: CRISPR-associated protein Cas4 [Clostridia bacterium]|nr:CRISPR-associated protein Cas4 [Clostridia bacterium]
MHLTGTHINYYLICQRKLWLFANQIQMEHTSDLVYEGKLIHETSYERRSEKYTELEIDGIKLDYYDAKNKVIHEIKKSDKREEAHLWQLKYYLFVLDKNGVQGATGILEYPKLRHREEVVLSSIDREELQRIIADVEKIVAADQAPERPMRSRCRNCSYFDFCWSEEEEDGS